MDWLISLLRGNTASIEDATIFFGAFSPYTLLLGVDSVASVITLYISLMFIRLGLRFFGSLKRNNGAIHLNATCRTQMGMSDKLGVLKMTFEDDAPSQQSQSNLGMSNYIRCT